MSGGRLDPAGAAVIILALAVAAGLVIGLIEVAFASQPISDQAGDLLSATFGTALGIIAVYVGQAAARNARRPSGKDPDHDRNT